MSSPASDAFEGQSSRGESSGSSGAAEGEVEVEKKTPRAHKGSPLPDPSVLRPSGPLPSALPPPLVSSVCPPSPRRLLSLQGKLGEKGLDRIPPPHDPPSANHDRHGVDAANEEGLEESEEPYDGAAHRHPSFPFPHTSSSSLPPLRGNVPRSPPHRSTARGGYAGVDDGVEPHGREEEDTNTTREGGGGRRWENYPPHHTSLPMHTPPPRYHNFQKGKWSPALASAAKGRRGGSPRRGGKGIPTTRESPQTHPPPAPPSSHLFFSSSPRTQAKEDGGVGVVGSAPLPASSAPPSVRSGTTTPSPPRKHTRVFFAATDRREKGSGTATHDLVKEEAMHGALVVSPPAVVAPCSSSSSSSSTMAVVPPPSSSSSPVFITATSLLSREAQENGRWATPSTIGPLAPPPKMSLWPMASARAPPPALSRGGGGGGGKRAAGPLVAPSRAPLALQVEAFIRKEHRQCLLHHPGCAKVETLEIFREAFRALAEHFSEYRPVLNLIQDEYEAALTEVEGEVKRMRIIDLENKSDRSLHAMELASVKESLNATISNQRAELLSTRGLIQALREQLSAAEKTVTLLRHELRENRDDRVHEQQQVHLLHSALIEEANHSGGLIKKLKAKDKDTDLLQSCVKVLREEVEELHLALMEQLHIAMDQRQQLANVQVGRGGDGSFSSGGSTHATLFRGPPASFPLSFNASTTSMPHGPPSALPFLGGNRAMDRLSLLKEMEQRHANEGSLSGSSAGRGKRKKKTSRGGSMEPMMTTASSSPLTTTSLRGEGDRKVDVPVSPGGRAGGGEGPGGNTYPELYVVSLLSRLDAMAWDLAQWKQKAQFVGSGGGAGDDPFSLLRGSASRWSQGGVSAFASSGGVGVVGGGGGGGLAPSSTAEDEQAKDRQGSGAAGRGVTSMESSTVPELGYSSAVPSHAFFLSSPSRSPPLPPAPAGSSGGLSQPPPLYPPSRSNSAFATRADESAGAGVRRHPSTPLRRSASSRPGEAGGGGGPSLRKREGEGKKSSDHSLLLPMTPQSTSTYRISSFSVDRHESSVRELSWNAAHKDSTTASVLATLPPEMGVEEEEGEGVDRRSSHMAGKESRGVVGASRSTSVVRAGGRYESRMPSFTHDTPPPLSSTSGTIKGSQRMAPASSPSPPPIASDAAAEMRGKDTNASWTLPPVALGGGGEEEEGGLPPHPSSSSSSRLLPLPRRASSTSLASVAIGGVGRKGKTTLVHSGRKKFKASRKHATLSRLSGKKVSSTELPGTAAEVGGGGGGGGAPMEPAEHPMEALGGGGGGGGGDPAASFPQPQPARVFGKCLCVSTCFGGVRATREWWEWWGWGRAVLRRSPRGCLRGGVGAYRAPSPAQ